MSMMKQTLYNIRVVVVSNHVVGLYTELQYHGMVCCLYSISASYVAPFCEYRPL